ncbi:kinase-like domain-containing protein [Syncephalis fuscata]|nr:kinase-like domain-containing protein [Syncephalis fuscata]
MALKRTLVIAAYAIVSLSWNIALCNAGTTQSRADLDSGIPNLEAITELIIDKWEYGGDKTTYIAKATYINKATQDKLPAFVKCDSNKRRHSIERHTFEVLHSSNIDIKSCGLLPSAKALIVKAYLLTESSNGHGCIVMESIVSGVSYLQCLKIAHIDIKPENILIYKDTNGLPNLRIIDFGIVEYLDHGEDLPLHCATAGYCAPELFKGNNPIDHGKNTRVVNIPKAISWSIGSTMYTYLNGFKAYSEINIRTGKEMLYAEYGKWLQPVYNLNKHFCRPIEIFTSLLSQNELTLLKSVKALVEQLMVPRPENRPKPHDILKNLVEPYLKEVAAAQASNSKQ